jgi:hypothetical protein
MAQPMTTTGQQQQQQEQQEQQQQQQQEQQQPLSSAERGTDRAPANRLESVEDGLDKNTETWQQAVDYLSWFH